MKNNETTAVNQKTLKLISPLMMAYLLILAVIDQLFYPTPTLTPTFYLIIFSDALVILALTYIPALRSFLGKNLLPIIIGLLVIVPITAGFFSFQGDLPPVQLPNTNMKPIQVSGPEMETLRLIPLTFTALILVAWQYRTRHIFVFCSIVTITQSILVVIRMAQQPDIDLIPWFVVMMIQLLSFIIVGYFIQLLMKQLKEQQAALTDANTNLINYASTLENLTISRERNAMARELHDTVAHTLSGLSVQLETVQAYLDVDLKTAKKMLDRSLKATRGGLQDTRRALQSLRATPLDDLGLINALKELAHNYAQRGNLELKLNLPQTNLNLPEAYEQVIYRTAQEALNNSLQHANATTLDLTLTRHLNEISLVLTDDGAGFDPEQEYANHFGLVGMRERAELLGGDFQIISKVGQGTQIQLILRNRQ